MLILARTEIAAVRCARGRAEFLACLEGGGEASPVRIPASILQKCERTPFLRVVQVARRLLPARRLPRRTKRAQPDRFLREHRAGAERLRPWPAPADSW